MAEHFPHRWIWPAKGVSSNTQSDRVSSRDGGAGPCRPDLRQESAGDADDGDNFLDEEATERPCGATPHEPRARRTAVRGGSRSRTVGGLTVVACGVLASGQWR